VVAFLFRPIPGRNDLIRNFAELGRIGSVEINYVAPARHWDARDDAFDKIAMRID